jgi:hypothetical protein
MKFHGNSYVLRVRVNNSLKIFFSETIIPRKLIFRMNVPWVGLFIICSNGSEIPIIFRTGSEKPRKLDQSLKIFFSRTANATGHRWIKNSFIISKRSFLKFVRGNFLWPIFFRLCFRKCEGMKNHNFNAQ